MDALKIEKPILAGFDWGARNANIFAALWPERTKAMVSVSGYLIGNQEAGKAPLPPKAELEWWYQFYFATERGRAGYAKYTHDFAKLIWQIASPQWKFRRRHVRIAARPRSTTRITSPSRSINYRWRIGVADGERKYDDLEKRLATAPVITVPTITMEGDANGAPHPEPQCLREEIHRQVRAPAPSPAASAHNLPQGSAPSLRAGHHRRSGELIAGRRSPSGQGE